MPYPNVEGKHGFDAIYSPEDSLGYRRKIESSRNFQAPEGVVLTHQYSALQNILAWEDGLKDHYVTQQLYFLASKDNKVGVSLYGLGASQAAVIMEELIAKGSRRFINIGVAGGVGKNSKVGDIVVCNKAIRDEGISHHYLEPGKYVDTSFDLTSKLKEKLEQQNLQFSEGQTWTIDAPFRETREEVSQYQEEGVLTVEMETAALAAVAKHRGVEFAAAFVISDLVSNEIWEPGFHLPEVVRALDNLHQVALSVL
ncbi:MAG: nucleoside phosphorylase [Candidatus Levyibacteriota bacterium]